MNKRTLWGCIAALGALMLFALITLVFDSRLNKGWSTPLGEIPLMDLLGVLVSMAAGGAIAGRRFRWIAVALMGLVWLLSVITLGLATDMTLGGVLRYNALAMVLTLALAWLGAELGPRLRARYEARRAG
jgi:hypothetical protein